jgi:hypothetical protein
MTFMNLETSNPKNAPKHILDYLNIDMVRGMYLRIDQFGSKEAIIKHLMVAPKYTYLTLQRSSKVMKAQEYFIAIQNL